MQCLLLERRNCWSSWNAHSLCLGRSLRHIMIANILETYTLSEIFEYNDLTEEEVLEYLVYQGIVRLPDVKPLGFEP